MPRNIYAVTGKFKSLFVIVIILCILGLLIYTQWLVSNLREDSRRVVLMWAGMYEKIASDEDVKDEVLNFLFENVIEPIYFPVIQTDVNREPIFHRNVFDSTAIDSTYSTMSPEITLKLKRIMHNMQRENEPVKIRSEGMDLGYIYYGDSRLIAHLRRLPYVEISIAGLLTLAGFVGFSYIRRSEQRFIWVGMAKETAHQLGTPISSLMGWLDILKGGKTAREMRQTAVEMGKDVQRLEKVAARFSQIGSKQDLKDQELVPILQEVVTYIRRRLPQRGEGVRIIEEYGRVPRRALNRDLFEWAIENLIKNSLDAVREKGDMVKIATGIDGNNGVFVDVIDNGCGIEPGNRKNIFKPGYSTKKRGWGLGLNLAKRIIEEYHRGKLILKESRIGEGTTMRIILYH